MTAIRQKAMEMMEKIPENKSNYVIHIMQGISGLIGEDDRSKKRKMDIEQFVMPTTERGQNADKYVRELRDYDRL